jgi:uncharacterized membrane protein
MAKKSIPRKPEKHVQTKKIMAVSESFSGPLPPPAVLKNYNEVISGAAERILQMAEKEGDHRRYVEKKIVDSESGQLARGSFLSFALGVLSLACGFILALLDKDVVGVSSIIVGIGSIITAFLLGRKKDNQKEE